MIATKDLGEGFRFASGRISDRLAHETYDDTYAHDRLELGGSTNGHESMLVT